MSIATESQSQTTDENEDNADNAGNANNANNEEESNQGTLASIENPIPFREEITISPKRLSKLQKARANRKRKKERKKKHQRLLTEIDRKLKENAKKDNENPEETKNIVIAYVSETYANDSIASLKFADVFSKFTPAEDLFKTPEQLRKEAEQKQRMEEKLEKEEERIRQESDPIDRSIIDLKKQEQQSMNHADAEEDQTMDEEKADILLQNNDTNHSPSESEATAMEVKALSNRRRKELLRPSIARLKTSVVRSDLVEAQDVNALDPYLLMQLKSMRNTVPVPEHWLQKRKFLQSKRGFLKKPFHLPAYISATGITDMRENRLQTIAEKSMKQKQRERMRPRKGGLEISYNTLHEAFFKHQTKPANMSAFGELYYEGKEAMMKFEHFRPGYVSDRLKRALGMTPRYRVVAPSGAVVQQRIEHSEDDMLNSAAAVAGIVGGVEWKTIHTLKYGEYVIWDQNFGSAVFTAGPHRNKRIHICSPVSGWLWIRSRDGNEDILKRCDVEDPPPWLINMQRFGPPPAYPDLKIAGLNAPIPPNRSYGFHEGQWGKPPVNDENGQPLYGDPFGIWTEPISNSWTRKRCWGTLEKFDESTDDDEDGEDDSDDDDEEDSDSEDGIGAKRNQSESAKMRSKKRKKTAMMAGAAAGGGAAAGVKHPHQQSNHWNKNGVAMDANVSLANGNLLKNSNLMNVHSSRMQNIMSGMNESGIDSVSGISSNQSHISLRKHNAMLMSGLESPISSISTQDLQLRKPELYRVLQPKVNPVSGIFGSSTVYAVHPEKPAANNNQNSLKRNHSSGTNNNNNTNLPPTKKSRR